MKEIKALIILPSYSLGGAEKVMMSYFQRFQNNKIDLQLLVINSVGNLRTKNKKNIIEFKYTKFIYSIFKLTNLLIRKKYKVIISSFPHISALLVFLKFIRVHNSKVIIRQPNMVEKSLSGTIKLSLLKYFYKFFVKYTDALIVTSSYMLNEAIMNSVKKNKIYLIRNPINIIKTRKNILPKRTKGETLKLVFVGRLVYQKGIDRVLHMFKKQNRIELILIGDGDQRFNLYDQAAKLKVLNKVKFLGFKKYPYNYIAGADYFFLPSRWEGLPNCVLESLALGTPVISLGDVHALKDYYKNIKNKSIMICKNVKDLEEKIIDLKIRPDHKKPKLRKNLLTKYTTPKRYNKKINEIINKVI